MYQFTNNKKNRLILKSSSLRDPASTNVVLGRGVNNLSSAFLSFYSVLHSQYSLTNMSTLELNLFGSPNPSGIRVHISSKRDFSTKRDLSDVKYTSKYKKEYALTSEQKEAIVGIMLGDGHLDRAKPNHNTRLQIDQSYPEKAQYVSSLYELLEPLVTMVPTILTRNDKRNGSVTQSMYFRTLSMPCLNYYHDLFYKGKVKSVPKNLGELLTARGLAYFIMDDRGKSVHGQTILHTRSFYLDDVKYIQSVLFENFGLTTRLEEKKKDQ